MLVWISVLEASNVRVWISVLEISLAQADRRNVVWKLHSEHQLKTDVALICQSQLSNDQMLKWTKRLDSLSLFEASGVNLLLYLTFREHELKAGDRTLVIYRNEMSVMKGVNFSLLKFIPDVYTNIDRVLPYCLN